MALARRGLALLLALPVAALLILAIWAPFSPSGWADLASLALLVAGLWLASWRVAGAGAGLLVATLAVRLVFAGNVTLPDGDHRLINRVFAERDGVIPAALFLTLTGSLPDDADAFVPALRDAYARFGAARGMEATPAIATYLGLQSGERFDIVAYEPEGEAERAVIFLHGYAGNFSIYCWQLSEAAKRAQAVTLCPSVGAGGAWSRSRGRAVIKRTIELARARGIDELYLAGLSNGGVGVATNAPKFAPGTFKGVILISGAVANAKAPRAPALLVHGRRDSMARIDSARGYAQKHGAKLVERPGGHMGFLDDHEAYGAAIADWLLERSRTKEHR